MEVQIGTQLIGTSTCLLVCLFHLPSPLQCNEAESQGHVPM